MKLTHDLTGCPFIRRLIPHCIAKLFPCVILSLSLPCPATALEFNQPALLLDGGRIISVSGKPDCENECGNDMNALQQTSYIALAEPGYRFTGWSGECSHFPGTLCTLNVTQDNNISAGFTKTQLPKLNKKALLLLPDPQTRPTVWNEFAKQNFGNRCPILFGGVIFGQDSLNPHNSVYCYRLDFGYFAQLGADAGKSYAYPSGQDESASLEIQAAVSAIRSKHPGISLMLVAQEHAGTAAQTFILDETPEWNDIKGLLILTRQKTATGSSLQQEYTAQSSTIPVLNLQALPNQGARINAALTKLTQTWWNNR